MNYSELVSAIQSTVENQFTTTDINRFIEQAEQRIYNMVQLPAIRKTTTGTVTLGNQQLTLPADWLAMFSLALVSGTGAYGFLLDKDVNFIRESYPVPGDTGLPQYYAVKEENTIIFGPTPDAAYAYEMNYYYYPESIVTANTTWLGDNFDSALLYGALLEAYTYMKGEQDVLAQYQKRYDEAMMMLKTLGDGKNRRDAYRNGQIRYPVP